MAGRGGDRGTNQSGIPRYARNDRFGGQESYFCEWGNGYE